MNKPNGRFTQFYQFSGDQAKYAIGEKHKKRKQFLSRSGIEKIELLDHKKKLIYTNGKVCAYFRITGEPESVNELMVDIYKWVRSCEAMRKKKIYYKPESKKKQMEAKIEEKNQKKKEQEKEKNQYENLLENIDDAKEIMAQDFSQKLFEFDADKNQLQSVPINSCFGNNESRKESNLFQHPLQ